MRLQKYSVILQWRIIRKQDFVVCRLKQRNLQRLFGIELNFISFASDIIRYFWELWFNEL